MFRVGQKVVCVDASGVASPFIVRGRVYTITGFDNRRAGNSDQPGLYLAEVRAVETRENYASFLARRFRPIVERKTDISIFTKMLTPKKRRVQERA